MTTPQVPEIESSANREVEAVRPGRDSVLWLGNLGGWPREWRQPDAFGGSELLKPVLEVEQLQLWLAAADCGE